jgi:transposase
VEGDATVIRAKRGRKQKTDREDARHILKLLLKDDFPRIWVPSWENRDLRQLLWHRHRMVQARTRVMNQLQAVALNEGLSCKKRTRDAPRRDKRSDASSKASPVSTSNSASEGLVTFSEQATSSFKES